MDTLPHCELHKICRICLKSDLLVSIYSPSYLLQPIEMIEKLHIFTLQPNDNLPTLLCQSCLYRLLDAYNLQQLAEASERRLRDYLNTNSNQQPEFTGFVPPPLVTMPTPQELSKDAGDSTASIYANICEMFERNVHATGMGMSMGMGMESVTSVTATTGAGDDMLNDVEIDVSSLTRSEADDTLSEVFVGSGQLQDSTEAAPDFSTNLPSVEFNNASASNETKEKSNKRTPKPSKIPDKCNQCGKIFRYSGYLEAHKRTHTGEKPFKCQFCARNFAQSNNLRLHQRMHSATQRRRFQCEICAAFFTTSSNLKAHALVHQQSRDFHCQRCERRFKSERELRRHEPVHKTIKDIICALCHKGFAKHSYLSAHMTAVHQGVRRYKCAECGKVFGSKSNLVCHARIHSGEKPYKCKYCPWKFNQASALARHTKKHFKSKLESDLTPKKLPDDSLMHCAINNFLEAPPTTTTTTGNYNLLHALPINNNNNMHVPLPTSSLSNQFSEVALSSTDTSLSTDATLHPYDFTKDGILDFSTSQQQTTQNLY